MKINIRFLSPVLHLGYVVTVLTFVFATIALSQTGTWTPKASISSPRYFTESAVANGVLYTTGGWNGCTPYNNVEAYDPTTDTWIPRAPMLTPRGYHAVAELNGLLYAVGGSIGCGAGIANVEAYDPTTNTWAAKAQLPTARYGHSVAAVNGKIYAIGGSHPTQLASVTEYDPVANTWTEKAPMPAPRYNFGAVVINDIIYVVGGGNYSNGSLDSVLSYDPVTDTWSAKSPLPLGRQSLETAVVGGLIYAMGGSGPTSCLGLTQVDVYDPATDSWSAGTPMPTPRSDFGTAALNGFLYIVGGYQQYDCGANQGSVASVFSFTPNEDDSLDPGDIVVANSGSVSIIDPVSGKLEKSFCCFGRVIGVGVDANGDIIVSDSTTASVIRIDYESGVQTVISSENLLVQPAGLEISSDGHIYVADMESCCGSGTGRIVRINPLTGEQILVSSGGAFIDPTGLDFETTGEMLVADFNARKLFRIDPATGDQMLLASFLPNGEPYDVAVNAGGDIFVIDHNMPGILRLDSVSGVSRIISSGGNFVQPVGIAIEQDGNILVTDFVSNSIIRVDPNTGSQTIVATGSPTLVNPWGIFVVSDPNPIDSIAPIINVGSPTESATYLLGQSVFADYFCEDESGGSGIASCTGLVANGSAIDTASVGVKTFTVTAEDSAGNQSVEEVSYRVVYAFSGFMQPVENLPTLNIAKAGSAIPVKFSLSGYQGLGIFALGYPASGQIACDANEPGSEIEETTTSGGSTLSYNPTYDQYSYVWKTDKSWKGSCRILVVRLIDGTNNFAKFRFR